MIFKGKTVSIYTFYKNVYKKDGLKLTLKIFYCKIRIWCWRTRENKNARVYLFKRKIRRLIKND